MNRFIKSPIEVFYNQNQMSAIWVGRCPKCGLESRTKVRSEMLAAWLCDSCGYWITIPFSKRFIDEHWPTYFSDRVK